MMFSTMAPREMLVTLNLYSHCNERKVYETKNDNDNI
jgi:hypothetical protein